MPVKSKVLVTCNTRQPSSYHRIVKQVRIYDSRGVETVLIKGTLTPCSRLPARTIVVPFSMVKAPSVKLVLKTWLQSVSKPGIPQPMYSMLPRLWRQQQPRSGAGEGISSRSGQGADPVGQTVADIDPRLGPADQATSSCATVDLAVVKSRFAFGSPARGSIDLVLLLDRERERNAPLRALLMRCA